MCIQTQRLTSLLRFTIQPPNPVDHADVLTVPREQIPTFGQSQNDDNVLGKLEIEDIHGDVQGISKKARIVHGAVKDVRDVGKMPPDPRSLLYTHGYVARMLGTRQAPGYFTQLLHFDERNFQLVVSNGAFLLLHPAVQNAHPTTHVGNRHAWLLDYTLRDVGTVVPQRLWSLAATSDAQRYGTAQLNMPIFFVERDRTTLGLPLNQAASGNCSGLLNARHPAPVGLRHTAFIRIMVSIFTSRHSSYEQLCE